MSKVDRKLFVPDSKLAYNDAPQVIGDVSGILALRGLSRVYWCPLS
jgi:hypothetical protein